MINATEQALAIARVATVKFFPTTDEETKVVVGKLFLELCSKVQREYSSRPAPDCRKCGGSGSRLFERHSDGKWHAVNTDGPSGAGELSAIARCKCVKPVLMRTWSPDEQVKWLSRRFVQLHIQWVDGLNELRAVYCARFKPPDGIYVDSAAYPDGLPSERVPEQTPAQLNAPETKRLTAADATRDPEMKQTVKRITGVASQRGMPPVRRSDLEAIRHLYTDEEYKAAPARAERRG